MDTVLVLALFAVVALLWLGVHAATEKGYSALLALGIMIVTSPVIGLIIIMLLPKRENLAEQKVRNLEMERMAILAEAIKKKQDRLVSSGPQSPTV